MQVSLIIPTYNSSAFIAQSIERLTETLDGLEVSYEIILIDDASTDDTWAVLQRCTLQYGAKVRTLRNRENSGQIRAIAAGVRSATGELLITYNDDLDVSEKFIPTMYQALLNGNDLVYLDYATRSDSPIENLFSSIFNQMVRRLLGAKGKVSNHRAWRANLLNFKDAQFTDNAFLDYRLLKASASTAYLPCPDRTRELKTSKHGLSKKLFQSLYVLKAIASERWHSGK